MRGLGPGAVLALRWVLWLLVGLSPVGVAVVAWQVAGVRGAVHAVSLSAVTTDVVDTAEVEAMAVVEVVRHVVSAGNADRTDATSVSISRRLVDAVSLGAVPAGPDAYAVLVAAVFEDVSPVETPLDEPMAVTPSVEVRVYGVGFIDTAMGWQLLGAPSIQARSVPILADDARQRPDVSLESMPGLAETVERFLGAYLMGSGDLSRYVTPDSLVRAVAPVPFERFDIVTSGAIRVSDTEVVAVVGVDAADEQRVERLEFWLSAMLRDGRWEIAAVLPAPLVEK